jgi:hypothetical protein
MPLPSMPTDRNTRRSVLSPKCPAKNMPAAYAERNARSTWPSKDCVGRRRVGRVVHTVGHPCHGMRVCWVHGLPAARQWQATAPCAAASAAHVPRSSCTVRPPPPSHLTCPFGPLNGAQP